MEAWQQTPHPLYPPPKKQASLLVEVDGRVELSSWKKAAGWPAVGCCARHLVPSAFKKDHEWGTRRPKGEKKWREGEVGGAAEEKLVEPLRGSKRSVGEQGGDSGAAYKGNDSLNNPLPGDKKNAKTQKKYTGHTPNSKAPPVFIDFFPE